MLNKFSAQCITENSYTTSYAYLELLLLLRVNSVVPLMNDINLTKYGEYKQETTIQNHKLVLQSRRRPMKPATYRSCG